MTRFDPTAPYEVAEEDVPYGGPADARLLARIYRPAGVPGPWPALVDVHGGAWAYFDRTADMYFDRALAACGMVVVALDFRQAPIRYPRRRRAIPSSCRRSGSRPPSSTRTSRAR